MSASQAVTGIVGTLLVVVCVAAVADPAVGPGQIVQVRTLGEAVRTGAADPPPYHDDVAGDYRVGTTNVAVIRVYRPDDPALFEYELVPTGPGTARPTKVFASGTEGERRAAVVAALPSVVR